MTKLISLAALVVLMCVSTMSQAGQITCTYAASGSGSLAGVPFTNKAFTITSIGDTNNRVAVFPTVYQIVNQSASIDIQSLGNFSFLTGTYSFVNQSFGVGFGGIGGSQLDLFNITDIPQASAWDMMASIGPVTTAKGHLDQWEQHVITTSGGVLLFNDSSDIACVFAAQVVPEPNSIVILLGALACLRLRRR